MRIIAGEFRGRALLSPVGMHTRPISDRAKLGLFNTLTGWMPGARVADIFCGTGSMGMEALSRGAEHCWFADSDPQALDLLRQNIATFRVASRSTVWAGDILANLSDRLAGLDKPLDVAFLDPPYALAEQWAEAGLPEVLTTIAAALADQAMVVYRTPASLTVPERIGPLALARRRRYGATAVNFLERA